MFFHIRIDLYPAPTNSFIKPAKGNAQVSRLTHIFYTFIGCNHAKPSNVPGRHPGGAQLDPSLARPSTIARSPQERPGTFWDMLALPIIFTAVCVVVGYHFRPFSISQEAGPLAGLVFAIAIIFFEVRLAEG